MTSAPLSSEETRRILDLVRRDRKAAEQALASLTPESQMALVCEVPLARRAEVLGLLPEPEAVIPLIPEAEFCFTVKAVGLDDASWLLECATPEQMVTSVDLEAWSGYAPDVANLDAWMEAFARTEGPSLVRAASALDREILVMWLKSRIEVFQKPAGDEDWQIPEHCQTLEGQFYYRAREEGADLEAVTAVLRALFDEDYWSYFRLMLGVIWELDSDNCEWALRWRTGRLEDLGFPTWDEAMQIYRFLGPEERGRIPEHARPLDVEGWRLPVWIPQLPEAGSGHHRVFRAIARLDGEERVAAFYALVAVANKVAVADQLPLGDAESTPRAIEKAARLISDGLAHVAAENALDDLQVLRKVTLERLFRVGANLSPESARP
ncbi:MAG TPA: DUF6178 family protein [Myxococcota bacterium]